MSKCVHDAAISKYGEIQIIDYSRQNNTKCDICEEMASFLITMPGKDIALCPECLGNLAHCLIDGLM